MTGRHPAGNIAHGWKLGLVLLTTVFPAVEPFPEPVEFSGIGGDVEEAAEPCESEERDEGEWWKLGGEP